MKILAEIGIFVGWVLMLVLPAMLFATAVVFFALAAQHYLRLAIQFLGLE